MAEVQVGQRKLPKVFSTKDARAAYANILVYSMARFGKTNLLRTLLQEGFKPIILGSEAGDGMGFQTISDIDIPVIPILSWDDFMPVYAELKKPRPDGLVHYKPDNETDVAGDVIVLDSLSAMGWVWTQKGLEVLNWKEIGVAHQGHDPRQIYAYIPEKGRQTVNALIDLPAHVILICRETLAEEGKGAERITYPVPELPGAKLPRELPGWLDAVVFGRIVNGKRYFLTEAEGKIIAGIRAPETRRFPKQVYANYGLLIKAMMGDDAALAAITPPAGRQDVGNKA